MHDVKKFFVCAFLGLVIFTPTCFAAEDCNANVEFSAGFKWTLDEVTIITDIDRKIADDTEVYDAAKARIDVLAGMFTKPLQQTKKFKCRESKTCEAGQTLQECSPALARCFADAIAQDEYIANLQNRLCNSGIKLNPQNDSLRELITSYTPLQLSAPTGVGSTKTPASSTTPARSNTSRADLANDNQMINDQINGRGNMSKDSGGVSGRGIGAIITEINTSAKNMKINAGFSYPESMVSTGGMQLQTAIANWIARCMEYPQGHESAAIKEMNHKKTTENGTVRHLCEIKSCLSEYMTPTEEGCKRDRTEIATLPSRSASLIPTGEAARATTKLEKDFVSDITKLSEAFESVVKRLTKECEKSGGTINDGVCKNAQTTDQQSKASNNRRGSGKRR